VAHRLQHQGGGGGGGGDGKNRGFLINFDTAILDSCKGDNVVIKMAVSAPPTHKNNDAFIFGMKCQSGLMINYYYIKPKCKARRGLPCWDYFVCVKEARVLTRDCHGWHQEALSSMILQEELFSRVRDHTRHFGKSVLSLFLGVDGGLTTLNNPHKPRREMREKMLQSGWTWQPGTRLMMDNFYITNDSNKCQCSLFSCINFLNLKTRISNLLFECIYTQGSSLDRGREEKGTTIHHMQALLIICYLLPKQIIMIEKEALGLQAGSPKKRSRKWELGRAFRIFKSKE
jgi:hypothetical protein